ncbi:SPOSA6832_04163 [Sporobolomyces salmonicolor]|uniref:SPOSA6832_04163-mRNA-1:cds n=1 Tax=Sporidiobolus salmonicolor TaxID=5005 RepID=A0A0D6EQX4_SPOSA|nr:SPOSA6832_04163 [Sporobolomyces salmonicolor]
MAQPTAEEKAFLDWFKGKGGTVHPAVGFKQFDGMGRGAVALLDIEPDTLLFSIPRSILLTTSTAALPSLLPAESWSALSGWTPLILSLMYEYLRTATWTPYLSLLPPPGSFNSLMFWSDDELADLKGSMVLGKIGKDEAEQEFEETVVPFIKEHEAVFGKAEDYTLELFHWMGSLVLSRSFHVDHKEEDEGKEDEEEDSDDEEEDEREDVADVAMVPFADLLNAKSGCDNLNMMATSRIPAGTQIFNTYADPPNSDLLRRYGHVDDMNEADLVEVGLESVVDLIGPAQGLGEEERERRAEWLLEMGIDDTFGIELNHSLPPELISAIRTFLLSADDFAKAQKKESPPKPKLDASSAAWARQLVERREAEYETSIEASPLLRHFLFSVISSSPSFPSLCGSLAFSAICADTESDCVQDDEALLKSSALSLRRRMAVIVRLGEKRILRATRTQLGIEYPPGSEDAKEKDKKRSRDGTAKDGSGSKGKRAKVE